MTVATPAPPALERALRPAFAALAVAVLLHVDRLPIWCSVAALAALAWRVAASRGLCRLPPALLRIGLTLFFIAATLNLFRSLGGLAAASALLTAMGALKLFETRSARDGRILVGAAIFLLVAACLDRQGLPRLPLYVASGWLSCAALLALGSPAAGASSRLALVTAARSLVLALPFAIACFLFFPRLAAPLWGAPQGAQAVTGLSDEMSPGSITELVSSDEIAFRVRFDAAPPPPRQRYWRGPVLHDFDGFTWRRGAPLPLAPPALEAGGEAIRHAITLEATGHNWWFALDTPEGIEIPAGQRATLGQDRQILSLRPVSQSLTYVASSRIGARETGPLPGFVRRLDLRLPAGRNPRSLDFARSLRAVHPDDADFVQALLEHFRTQGFRYSLAPPPLQRDAVDDLLFRTREGFCGHFASALAMLLRAGGVPARVVTGYLGGDWNAYGGYYTVRQAEAHAWTEAWIEGRGWTRVDPTAVVEPARLDRALRQLLPDETLSGTLRSATWARTLFDYWDAGSQWWQQRVVGFNTQSQRALLERFGLPDVEYGSLVLLLTAGGALWLGFVAWQLRQRPASPGDPLARAWDALRETLGQGGVGSLAHAGPQDLAHRGRAAWPDLGEELQAIADRYAALRYGPGADENEQATRALVRRIRRLLPRIQHRRSLLQGPGLPEDVLAMLSRRLPLYRRMPAGLRQRCSRIAREFLQRVRFEGCGGLSLTDDMRHLVAFQAALLVAHRGLGPYRALRSVLLYPDEFLVHRRREDDDGVVTEGTDLLSGETWDEGRVILSWRDVEQGLAEDGDYNVVLHEFAHLLDHAVGGELSRRPGEAASTWHDVMETEHAALCEAVDAGEDTLIDPYGAEDQAEFFAVCTESFFGLPTALKARHPALHAALAAFYGCDPADWVADEAGGS